MRFHVFVPALLLACAPAVPAAQPAPARCEEYKTQMDANRCTVLRIDRADSAMEGVYRQVAAGLDPALAEHFEKVQRAWAEMRNAECLLRAEPMRGGSIYPAEYGACLAEQIRRRTRDLRQMLPDPAGKLPARFAVEEAAHALFGAMARKDTAALRRLLHPRALIVSVPAGGTGAQVRTVDEWIPSVARSPEMLRERMWDAEVEIEGDLATLWAPYEFHLGERFSHCGSDAFQFVRQGGGWTLIAVTFTRRTAGCEPAP